MSVNFCTVTQHIGLADADLLVEYRCFSFQMKDVRPYLARHAHNAEAAPRKKSICYYSLA